MNVRSKPADTRRGLPPAPTTPVLFFLSGFPDKHNSFDQLAPKFAETHTLAAPKVAETARQEAEDSELNNLQARLDAIRQEAS